MFSNQVLFASPTKTACVTCVWQVHCIPGDNGEYHYAYRTAKAGVYFVGILSDGVDIGGSPFKLTVDAGPTHANGCSASGPGISGSYTGVETSFVIQVAYCVAQSFGMRTHKLSMLAAP
jgi:hypothetical protein